MKVALASSSPGADERETRLASKLDIPVIAKSSAPSELNDYDYVFVFSDGKLCLVSTDDSKRSELCVDFLDAKLNYRANSGIRGQNIAKAIGIKGDKRPLILDATAGLGKDAFLMASLGCEVTLLERSRWVHALLEDGLSRADYYGQELTAILSRMQLHYGDLLDLASDSQQYDVVYLDPMFPERRKSAKVKKDMAALQSLLGHQSDGERLLEHASLLAARRVVVKRAKLSPHLGASKPDIEFKGSSSRYDVYLIN